MAKTIRLRTPLQEKEAMLISGMYGKEGKQQYELYAYCSDYFWENYKGVFFAEDNDAEDIFQNTFIAFWENIEKRKIYAEEGIVKDKNGEPLKGSILTYFMGIAKLKYLEWVRDHQQYTDSKPGQIAGGGVDVQKDIEMLYDPGDNVMLEIIADIISHISPRCNEILTKFYYEKKDLDRILQEIPTIESKNALKTKKYKCLETLRKTAMEIYDKYLNS
ncbi:MAG: hypothetical protein LUD48_06350 [Prevotella sp.]|nr:hypothetical protein [Prevotella sp.]